MLDRRWLLATGDWRLETGMRFANPEYLNLLWAVPALGLFFFRAFRNRRKRLESIVGSILAPTLTDEFSRGKAILKAVLLLGFFVFGILAASRPQWGTKLHTLRHQRGNR